MPLRKTSVYIVHYRRKPKCAVIYCPCWRFPLLIWYWCWWIKKLQWLYYRADKEVKQ